MKQSKLQLLLSKQRIAVCAEGHGGIAALAFLLVVLIAFLAAR